MAVGDENADILVVFLSLCDSVPFVGGAGFKIVRKWFALPVAVACRIARE